MRTSYSTLLMLVALFSVSGQHCRAEGNSPLIRTGYVELDGARLYFESRGDGVPLMLLHAGVADGRMWDLQMEALADRFTVVRVDLRGFGSTELGPGKFSDHGDVAALMDHLSIDEATIIGVSYGGQVAIDFALAFPEKVSSLVLGAPSVSGYQTHVDIAAFGKAEKDALDAGDLDAAVELNLRMWVDGPHREPAEVDPKLRAKVAAMQREIFEKNIPDGVVPIALDPPAAGRLSEISAPTLVLIGELDVVPFVQLAKWVATQIPDAKLQSVPNVAHMLSMEAAEIFNRAVTDFASRD